MSEMKTLPTDSEERKRRPLTTGCLDYFPAALAEVAYVSWVGNQKHNPGEPLHWSRGKSTDHADCEARHLVERGGFDEVTLPSGEVVRLRHSAERAWRALADLQLELEEDGAPLARGAQEPKSSESSEGRPPTGWHLIPPGQSANPGDTWWCESCSAWHALDDEGNFIETVVSR